MSLRVLFVDDEPSVLTGLGRMLRQSRRGWELFFAPSGQAALELLESEPIDAVVSDSQMPGMDGATLLERIRAERPNVARIMLSGQVKSETSVRIPSAAHQFLQKPCPADELCDVIERIASLRRLITAPETLTAVVGIDALPSPPALLESLNALLDSPDASIDSVAAIVGADVAISTKLLQLVNSSFFGVRAPVSEVRLATSLLGLNAVRSVTTCTSLLRSCASVEPAVMERIEEHSCEVAAAAAASALDGERDAAFGAGILHDVGWLILADRMPDAFADYVRCYESDGYNSEREAAIFGACHTDVGAALLALWGLPEPIIETAAWHHRDPATLAPAHARTALADRSVAASPHALPIDS